MPPNALENETGKTRPFNMPEQSVVLNILRTNELLQHRFGRLFREYHLTQPQYNILRILRGEGDRLPCLEIANRMIAVVPAITRLIDKLEQRGLVTKERCAKDRRVWFVEITERGLELLSQLDGPMRELYRQLVGHLSHEQCMTLVKLLEETREPLIDS